MNTLQLSKSLGWGNPNMGVSSRSIVLQALMLLALMNVAKGWRRDQLLQFQHFIYF